MARAGQLRNCSRRFPKVPASCWEIYCSALNFAQVPIQYCEQVINYCFQNCNKLLVVLISQDLEEPSPIATCSIFFPYHYLSSEICGSSYCAWNHTYLNTLKKNPTTQSVVCFAPSLILLKLCSQCKISSLIPYAVLIKAFTFLMVNFDWRGLSWLLHCPVAHSL